MSQHDMVIDNGDGATVRADLNNALAALASTNKGTGRPSTAYAGQLWIDDNTPSSTEWSLYCHDGADDILLGTIDVTNNIFLAAGPSFRGMIAGLTLSNNSTDAINDIDIAAGAACDSGGAVVMRLATGITKRLDAAWAVGTGNGGLDTGALANGTYHVWLIRRPDTGVVDVLFSTSATSPTMPTNYTQKRRIGSIIRASGAILAFTQFGDEFRFNAARVDINTAALATGQTNLTLASVPSGIVVDAIVRGTFTANATANELYILRPGESAVAGANCIARAISTATFAFGEARVKTNTSQQLSIGTNAGVNTTLSMGVLGWVDRRGRDD